MLHERAGVSVAIDTDPRDEGDRPCHGLAERVAATAMDGDHEGAIGRGVHALSFIALR